MNSHNYTHRFVQQYKENRKRALKFGFLAALSVMLLGAMLGVSSPVKAAHAQAYDPHSSDMNSMVQPGSGAQTLPIGNCESSANSGAVNFIEIGDCRAAEPFQILYPRTWYTTSQTSTSPYNTMTTILAAH